MTNDNNEDLIDPIEYDGHEENIEETPPPITEPTVTQVQEEEVATIIKNATVMIYQPITIPNENKGATSEDNKLRIHLPAGNVADVSRMAEQLPRNQTFGTSPESLKWAESFVKSNELSPANDTYQETLDNEDYDPGQELTLNGRQIKSGYRSFKNLTQTRLTGDVVTFRAMSSVGAGRIQSQLLINSGLFIDIKPSFRTEDIDLVVGMERDKISAGRSTYGLALSNTLGFTYERLSQFFLEHTYRICADQKEINHNNLLGLIKITDIQSIIKGMICATNPNGIAYSRACIANPTKCQYREEGTFNPENMEIFLRNKLTDKQKAHLLNNRSKQVMTIKQLEEYQSEFATQNIYSFTTKTQLGVEYVFNLRVPSISEYFSATHGWIDELVDASVKALTDSDKYDERNEMIETHMNATVMRQYSHWIESIVEKESENIIDSSDDINKVLNVLSVDDNIRTDYFNYLSKFINNSTAVVYGVQSFTCPNCNGENMGPKEFPYRESMIPVDMMNLFLDLLQMNTRFITRSRQ